ncbi:MAG: OmpH family outer membrane protein [Verrucomicrobiae bacterium]|nr:OmpH family outer membrane protein [Verrucomicrobiae bacterium]
MSLPPRLFVVLVLFACFGSSPRISAQTPAPGRIAVIDLARAFQSHPDTPGAEAALTADRNAARDVFKEKSEALKKALQEHQELIRLGKKPEAAEILKTANTLETEIATLRTTQQRDLEERFRREKERIVESIRSAVRQHNADRRYAVILDKSAESAFGIPAVIDASGAEDITDEIISQLKKNATTPKQPKTP